MTNYEFIMVMIALFNTVYQVIKDFKNC